MNSVREDPNREGLLYAGTNHGVYVTFDDGGWWQELNPGLPDIPVTDVIPEHDALAMASHGRGFWVLDNVGPLRQYRPGILDDGIVMFDPAPAYRSANGVVLTYSLPRDSMEWDIGGASLEIRDEGGNVVQSFAPAREGEERDRWSGPPLPMNKGWNRLRWDLRTDPATAFPGMILWGVRVRDEVDRANRAVIEMRNRSNQDPLNFPIRVNSRLANLLSMSERGDGRPGEGMVEVFGVMRGRLEGIVRGGEGGRVS